MDIIHVKKSYINKPSRISSEDKHFVSQGKIWPYTYFLIEQFKLI